MSIAKDILRQLGVVGDDIESAAAGFRNDGIAQPNKFEVILSCPTGTRGSQRGSGASLNNIFSLLMGKVNSDGTARSTGLRCSQISFPGRTMDTEPDTNIYGPTREIVQGYTFPEITGTFQCGPDMKEKQLFESWQRLSYNRQTWSIGYYDDYVGRVQIYQLDERGARRYGIELIEAFPKAIAEQALDYAQNDSFHTIGVTFSYRYWKSLNSESSLPAPLEEALEAIGVDQVRRTTLRNVAFSKRQDIGGT